jgi:hypothetical protein|nr:MAG TPA: hypothetical protein [Inoviridae sp.]
MKKSYNADRFIVLFEKFYRDFEETEKEFRSFDDGTGKFDSYVDDICDIKQQVKNLMYFIDSRGFKLDIQLEPSLFS